jgi:acetylornithine deacetylase/succinyl-diaminopimelate desuccinylase-like protein
VSVLVAPATVLSVLEERHDEDLAQLLEFVAIASVSADSRHERDVRRAAEFVADRLRRAGPFEVAVHETGRHPVVTAEWRGAAGAPTVLVYGHYDVQPPDPLAAWRSAPFEPRVEDGRIYARGVSDDKAPMFVPITVAAAYFQALDRLPVNLVFLYEGEEEIGSPSLEGFVLRERERLRADFVLSADGGMWRADHPSTMFSTRGLVALELTVRGAAKDLHSGRHGGSVANPLHALAELLAGLHDDAGRVSVPGFYDDVLPISRSVREATATLPFDEQAYLTEIGAPSTYGEAGFSTLERQWYRPTLEVNGMWGGYTGEGSKTVLPSEAHAKITCRLVADQDPTSIMERLKSHLQATVPQGTTLAITESEHGAHAYRLSEDHPGLLTAVDTLEAVYGVRPWVIGMGGSVPICSTFQRSLGMDTVFFSFAVGDEDIHAPNEFFRLRRFGEGRRAWADYFARLPQVMGAS